MSKSHCVWIWECLPFRKVRERVGHPAGRLVEGSEGKVAPVSGASIRVLPRLLAAFTVFAAFLPVSVSFQGPLHSST
jgi:hypothetical protein